MKKKKKGFSKTALDVQDLFFFPGRLKALYAVFFASYLPLVFFGVSTKSQ